MKDHISRAKMLDVNVIEEVLRDKDTCGVDGPELLVGKILLFSCWVGEEPEQLAIASTSSLDETREVCRALTENGVFGKGIDHFANYFEEKDSGACLNCDIQVGMGRLVREQKGGEPSWRMTAAGHKHVEEQIIPNMDDRQDRDAR